MQALISGARRITEGYLNRVFREPSGGRIFWFFIVAGLVEVSLVAGYLFSGTEPRLMLTLASLGLSVLFFGAAEVLVPADNKRLAGGLRIISSVLFVLGVASAVFERFGS